MERWFTFGYFKRLGDYLDRVQGRHNYVSITETWIPTGICVKPEVFFHVYKKKLRRANNDICVDVNGTRALDRVAAEVVHSQLMAYPSSNNLLHSGKHGISTGGYTVSKVLLIIDTYIFNVMTVGHPFDILTFYFKRIFDRASH